MPVRFSPGPPLKAIVVKRDLASMYLGPVPYDVPINDHAAMENISYQKMVVLTVKVHLSDDYLHTLHKDDIVELRLFEPNAG